MVSLSEFGKDIDFYDNKLILNRILYVDLGSNFNTDGVVVVSNLPLNHFYLRNSLNNLYRRATDISYIDCLNNINLSISGEKNKLNNLIFTYNNDKLSKRDFIIVVTKLEKDDLNLYRTIDRILENNHFKTIFDEKGANTNYNFYKIVVE